MVKQDTRCNARIDFFCQHKYLGLHSIIKVLLWFSSQQIVLIFQNVCHDSFSLLYGDKKNEMAFI